VWIVGKRAEILLTSRSAEVLLRGGMLMAPGMCDIAYSNSKRTSKTGMLPEARIC